MNKYNIEVNIPDGKYCGNTLKGIGCQFCISVMHTSDSAPFMCGLIGRYMGTTPTLEIPAAIHYEDDTWNILKNKDCPSLIKEHTNA